MIKYTVENVVETPMLHHVKLGGATEKIMDAFFQERIYSDFAKEVIYQEAEDALKNQVDDQTAIGYWQGEFWGKWIISACRAYRYSKDESLKAFIQKAADNVLALQRKDGYIGSYRNSTNFMAANPEETVKLCGWNCIWNWNVWGRKYTLWGLLECYQVLEDERILSAAKKHAELIMHEIEEKKIRVKDTGNFHGLPSCSILKPMLILYRYTEDKKFLDFCIGIAKEWEREDGEKPNLIQNALSQKKLSEWYPQTQKWAKAYEMLSCFEGIVELYRYTGNITYLLAAERFYDILKENEYNLLYSVAYNDMFTDAANELNALSEPCDVIHWMRLSFELYQLSDDVKYMDDIEKAFFNPFLASIYRDGKWAARCVRANGRHLAGEEQSFLRHNHCCVNNIPRGFMTMAAGAVVQKEGSVIINQFEENSVKLELAQVSIKGAYFTKGIVSVDVCFAKESCKICIRIPAWCDGATICHNGNEYTAQSGYFEIDACQKENRIDLDFHIKPVFHEFKKEVPVHPENDWRKVRWANNELSTKTNLNIFPEQKLSTVSFGATLLAKSKEVGSTHSDMFDYEALISEDFSSEANLIADENVRLHLQLTFEKDGKQIAFDACDYTSAGNNNLIDPCYFSIYF